MSNLFKIKFLFLLAMAACQPMPAKTTPTHTPNSLNKKEIAMKSSPQDCKSKLHKVADRDDLIRQMYETAILEDCLYDFSAKELENIWQIPVYNKLDEELNVVSNIDLYVTKWDWAEKGILFSIEVPKTVSKEHEFIFTHEFPEFLPIPNKKQFTTKGELTDYDYSKDIERIWEEKNLHKKGFIQPNMQYYWHYQGREMFAHNYIHGVTSLTFTNNLQLTQLNHY